MRLLGACVLLVIVTAVASADEKENAVKAEKLRKEIAALKAQIKEKEAELAKLEPVKPIEWKVGSIGVLPEPKEGAFCYYVVRLIAPGEVIVVMTNARGNDQAAAIHLKGVKTAGAMQGQPITIEGKFKVIGDYIFQQRSLWSAEQQK